MTWLPGLFGLRVTFGTRFRPPAAEFTCRYGCIRYAQGAAAVIALVRHPDTWHDPNCPALKENHGHQA